MNIPKPLSDLKPCHESVLWLETQSDLQSAWTACPRGDWMLWLVNRTCGPVNTNSHRKFTLAKAKCARLVLHLFERKYPDDKRPRMALEAAEAYAGGEMRSAYVASADVSAYAADADADAAYASAYAAYADYARFQTLSKCADEIRTVFPMCPL